MATNDDIEAAQERCDVEWRRAGSVAPCYAPRYMAARKAYHALLVRAGLLRPERADK